MHSVVSSQGRGAGAVLLMAKGLWGGAVMECSRITQW